MTPLMRSPLMLHGHPLMGGFVDWMLVIYYDNLVDMILVHCLDEFVFLLLVII